MFHFFCFVSFILLSPCITRLTLGAPYFTDQSLLRWTRKSEAEGQIYRRGADLFAYSNIPARPFFTWRFITRLMSGENSSPHHPEALDLCMYTSRSALHSDRSIHRYSKPSVLRFERPQSANLPSFYGQFVHVTIWRDCLFSSDMNYLRFINETLTNWTKLCDMVGGLIAIHV